MKDLHAKLNQAGYICEPQLAAAVRAALATRPVAGAFLFGPAGAGKSYLPEILSKVMQANYFFYQCFPGTREDDLLVKMLPSEDTISGIALHDGVIIQAVTATHQGSGDNAAPVILVLDEWDKTRPSADSFLLDFLQTGRINYNDRSYRANLDRLHVFLTMNDEREISEPLLRRLPIINFKPLPPALVYKALCLSHEGHPHLDHAIVLYERSLMADLPKPATIQELRQLLDAINALGEEADWDALVFQFVTKTEEAHELLRRVEDMPVQWVAPERARLRPEAYEDIPAAMDGGGNADDGGPQMPRLREARQFEAHFPPAGDSPDLERSYGIFRLSDEVYNEVVRMVPAPGADPAMLGEVAEVVGSYLSFTRPLPLKSLPTLENLWGQEGEILLHEPLATWEDVKALQEWGPMKIVKFSRDEILAKAEGIDLRWRWDLGAEIIVDLRQRRSFEACFGQWGKWNEGKWLGAHGLLYRRYQREILLSGQEKITVCDLKADIWGVESWDSLPDDQVPLLESFLRETTYDFHRPDGNTREFHFPGIVITFQDNPGTAAKPNDYFGVRIFDKFPATLLPYLHQWLPGDSLPMEVTFRTPLEENELLHRHGFVIPAGNTAISVLQSNGFFLRFEPRQQLITIRATLQGAELTKEKVDYCIDAIRSFVVELG